MVIHFILFADDTTLFFTSKTLEDLKFKIDIDLANISQWLYANKVTLNLNKSNFMLFSLCKKNIISLTLKNHSLKQSSCTKYLGVLIDEHLSWKDHMCSISKCMAQGIEIMNKIKNLDY